MKKALLSFILINVSLLLFAHKGSVKGYVFDQETKASLPGAHVTLNDSGLNTVTDVLGNFEFTDLEAGTYQLNISFIGYAVAEQTITITDDKTTDLKIGLSTGPVQLSDAVVVANNRYEQNIATLDLALRPLKSAQEMLQIVPGVFTAQHAGGGKAEQIFLRGFDIDHGTDINIEVDGMPVNMVSHSHGQGYADAHFLIPETVGSMDFGKGAYNAEKGNLATAGYVGFNTKNSLANNAVKMEVGQFNTTRTLGMFNLLGEKAKEQNQHLYLATEWLRSDGPFESPQDFNRLNIFAKYNGLIDDDKIISASLSSFSSSWYASGQIPERAVASGLISRFGAIDNTEGGKTSRKNANFQYTKFLDNDAIIRNQFYYTYYDFELYSNFTFFLADSVNGDQIRQREKRNLYGYKGNFEKSGSIGNVAISTLLGWGIRYDDINELELSHTKNRTETLEQLAYGEVDESNLNFHIKETFSFRNNLKIEAGLRFDHFNFAYVDLRPDVSREKQTISKSILSPKLNFYYDATKKTRFFLKTGKGFHSNDTRVIIQQTGKEILPATYGFDLGTVFKPFSKMFVQAALWSLHSDQEFVYVGDAGIVEPGGRSLRTGIDISLRYEVLKNLILNFDINKANPQALDVAENENRIPLAPTLTSSGSLTFKQKNGISTSIRYRYLGDRSANETNSLTAKGFFLMDANINYSKKNFEIGLSAINLLNSEWNEAQFETTSRLRNETTPSTEIHFTPGSPFTLSGSITYLF